MESKSMKLEFKTIGTDTEVFLQTRAGKPVPVIGLIGGTKEKPRSVLGGKGYAIQEDNVMAEFNIPPAVTARAFSASIDKILARLTEEVGKHDLEINIAAACHFDPKQLEHPQAQHIGCEPDFCVWTRSINEFDESKRDLLQTMRSSGGHVHVGFTDNGGAPTIDSQELVVMFLDLFLGVPSVVLDKDHDRRKLYGKAGAFRPKPYGVEYRVLSNFWIAHESLREWVFNNTYKALLYANDSAYRRALLDRHEDIIQTINTQNVRKVNDLVAQFGVTMPRQS